LVLFLEHMPHILEPWLQEHPDRACQCLNDLRATVAFLRERGVIHFDVHFWNVVTDGEQLYLADYGLVLDRSFALTKEEELFFQRNTYYDYGEILWSLAHEVVPWYNASSEVDKQRVNEKYGVKEDIQYSHLVFTLLNNIEEIHDSGLMKLDDGYVASIVKYRGIIDVMHDFYSDMWTNNKKDTKLRHAKLLRLLKETKFLPAASTAPPAR
jgi:hypothetical protein